MFLCLFLSLHLLLGSLCVSFPVLDCQVSDWGQWSECNTSCGAGIMTRSRKVIQPAQNGGKHCPTLLQKRGCQGFRCHGHRHDKKILRGKFLQRIWKKMIFKKYLMLNAKPASDRWEWPYCAAAVLTLRPKVSWLSGGHRSAEKFLCRHFKPQTFSSSLFSEKRTFGLYKNCKTLILQLATDVAFGLI